MSKAQMGMFAEMENVNKRFPFAENKRKLPFSISFISIYIYIDMAAYILTHLCIFYRDKYLYVYIYMDIYNYTYAANSNGKQKLR